MHSPGSVKSLCRMALHPKGHCRQMTLEVEWGMICPTLHCDKISPAGHSSYGEVSSSRHYPSDLYCSTQRKRRFQPMYEDALARVDLFSGLRKKELTEVAKCCREARYSPGSDRKSVV